MNPLKKLSDEDLNKYYNERLLALLTDEIKINKNLSFIEILTKLNLLQNLNSKQLYLYVTTRDN